MNYLYRYTKSQIPQNNSSHVGDFSNGDSAYLLPNADTKSSIIGKWNNDGSLIYVDSLAYAELRPFGNDIGVATDELNLHHYQGHAQRQMQETAVIDTLPEYPADNQPFKAILRRRWDDTPGWEGSGWEFIVEFADPTRSPTNRAIGIYADAECTQYLYTTGQLIHTDTGEIDADENPIYKYMTFNPAGKSTDEKEVINYALLFGAAQEGHYSLPPSKDEITLLFWENDQ